MRIHVIESGRLRGNAAFLRGTGMSAALRRPRPVEFPVLSFVVEHPDGLIAVDTGLRAGMRVPRPMRRVAPVPVMRAPEGMAGAMRRAGLDPAGVRTVLLTHLDWDHAGGVADFPGAEILVHRPELDAAAGVTGRLRYARSGWPAGFAPAAFDLDGGAYGAWDAARELAPGLIVVPLPGHSRGQVGLIAEATAARPAVLLAADSILREDWWREDLAAGGGVGLGQFDPAAGADTVRRLGAQVQAEPTVVIPSHDADAPARLAESAALASRIGGA